MENDVINSEDDDILDLLLRVSPADREQEEPTVVKMENADIARIQTSRWILATLRVGMILVKE